MGQKEFFAPRLDDLPHSATIVIFGAGPSSFHLVHELRSRIGSKDTIAVFEQNPVYSYTAQASLRQFRLYQGTELLARMVDESVETCLQISQEIGHSLLTPFPYIMVANSNKQMDELKTNLATINGWNIQKRFGVSQILTPEEVRKTCSLIDKDIAGALLYADAGRFDFDEIMQFIIKDSRNTSFYYRTRGGNIKIEHGKVVGVEVQIGNKTQFIACEKVVLAPGPFLLEEDNFLVGGRLLPNKTIRDIITVKKRESFSALLYNAPKRFRGFIIAPDLQYVSIFTDSSGEGTGIYGFANPNDPDIKNPEAVPLPGNDDFYEIVFGGLAQIISRYALDHEQTLTERIDTKSRRAGFYVHTPDGLPIISELLGHGSGLYVSGGYAGEGIMLGPSGGRYVAELVTNGLNNNPFDINRSFNKSGENVVF